MKRYLVFAWLDYTADNTHGWDAFQGDYETLEEIEQDRLIGRKKYEEEDIDYAGPGSWAMLDSFQIVDTRKPDGKYPDKSYLTNRAWRSIETGKPHADIDELHELLTRRYR